MPDPPTCQVKYSMDQHTDKVVVTIPKCPENIPTCKPDGNTFPCLKDAPPLSSFSDNICFQTAFGRPSFYEEKTAKYVEG